MKLNTPNKLIILRFLLTIIVIILLLAIPFFPEFTFLILENDVSWFNLIAMIFFVFAAFTDWLDGWLARKNNQVTNFGKLFDPLADKILVNSVLVIFTVYSRIPVWVVLIFIIRDILVDGLRMILTSKGKILAAGKSGKLKTLFQFIGITLLFIFYPTPPVSWNFNYLTLNSLFLIPLYIGLFFSIASGFIYYKENLREVF